MDTKITVIYDNPQDPGAFEAGYPEHLALAEAIPGVMSLETSRGGVRIVFAEVETSTVTTGGQR